MEENRSGPEGTNQTGIFLITRSEGPRQKGAAFSRKALETRPGLETREGLETRGGLENRASRGQQGGSDDRLLLKEASLFKAYEKEKRLKEKKPSIKKSLTS